MPTVPPSTGMHVLSGSGIPGVLELLTTNYTLYDARLSFINWHWGYPLDPTDDPSHNFQAPNESGYITDWPWIVPFNEGWICLQDVTHYASDPHFSLADDTWVQLTIIDKFGNWIESRRTEWTEWSFVRTDPGYGPYDYQPLYVIAGNQANRLLVMIQNHHETAGVFYNRFFWCDFDPSDWSFTKTVAFDKPNDGSYGYGGLPWKQYDMGSGGYMVVAQTLFVFGGGVTPLFLDADLDWIDPPTGWPTVSYPVGLTASPVWRTDTRCHVVETSVLADDWTAHPINYDGTTVTFGATTTGSFVGPISGNSQFEGNGMADIHDWDDPTPPRPDNLWVPSDGSARYVMPNIAQVESVFYDTEGDAFRKDLTVYPVTMVDWNDQYPVTSPYNGNGWSQKPYVIRFNMTHWASKATGYYDIEVPLPVPPSSYYDGDPDGKQYDDVDLDEAGYSIVNPWNGHILIWHYTYWRIEPRYFPGDEPTGPPDQGTPNAGLQSGQNRLTTYWVFGLPDAAPPETPAWVNFFNTGGVPDPDCPMLGSGENRAFLYDRGGARKIGEITDTTLIRWSRTRDDISTATVLVNTPNPECANLLKTIAVGRHEVVIFRDGQRMWEGPITRVGYEGGGVEIACEDVWFYTARTIMHHAYDNRYSKTKSKVGPVTHRAQIILATELARKERLSPSFNLLRFLDVRTHPNTTRTSRYTPAYASTVWEEIDYMAAKLSLDYTAVGRRMLLTDVHDVIGRTELLTDKDFSNPLVITTYGRELATRSAVTDGEGHWAAVGGIDAFYGEYELLNTTYGEEVQPQGTTPTAEELKALQAEMASQAQRNLAGRYPVPTVVRVPDNTALNPAAPIIIDDLVPGMRIPIRATQTVLTLEQEQKLDSVTVEQTSAGEVVTIVLSPAPGTTPWDDSSETGGDGEVTT